MPIEKCECGTTYAVGMFRCPRCKTLAPRYAEAARLIKKGTRTMPRITVASGPSNAGAAPGEVGFIERAEHNAAEVEAEVVAKAKAEAHAVEAWTSKPIAHLRKVADERGLSAAGSKAELAARLAEHDAKAPAAEAAPTADPAPEAARAEAAEAPAKTAAG